MCYEEAKFNIITEYDLLMVCGLYKSGTSLISTIVEKRTDFFNPANENNQLGRALGRNGDFYTTKECNILFDINKMILQDEKYLDTDKMLSAYLRSWRMPLILKDPKFVFTLPLWVSAARETNIKTIVLFTHRDYDQLKRSWKNAPFTSLLLEENVDAIDVMLKEQMIQQDYCEKNQVPVIHFTFEELNILKTIP